MIDGPMTTAEMLAALDRDVSAVELTDRALRRAHEVNPQLNCFTEIFDDALDDARVADAERAAGRPLGVLHGVPVAVKDTTPLAGRRTTSGSVSQADWVPDHDGFVARALRDAGAIIIGHTTTPEFAHALICESPLWGVTRNPWDLTKTTGGSSGGSGAAVSAGVVPLAEGSDMGGSVRIPAAWCGVVGLKPSLGRIPMDVLPGLFDQLSHHGPLARTIDDARRFMEATQGPDDADVLSIPANVDFSTPVSGDLTGLRVALSIDLGCWWVDPQIERAIRASAEVLRSRGAVVEEIAVDLRPEDEAVWAQLWAIFMAGYYGDRLEAFRDRMDADVVNLIEQGRRLTAVDTKRLEVARTDTWTRLRRVFVDHDALLCPTMAQQTWAATKAENAERGFDLTRPYRSPDMTAVFNLTAPCPALSVPCGLSEDGMPIGAQVVGRRWREDTVLRIGQAIEDAVSIGSPDI